MVCFASYLTGLTALVAVIAPVFAAPVPERSLLKIRDFEGDDIVPDSKIEYSISENATDKPRLHRRVQRPCQYRTP